MNLTLTFAFWALAAVTVGSALAVVLARNLFRAALFLVASFGGVAGLYVILNADFLAAVQVLIYVGAISVLLLFAILLTPNAPRANRFNRLNAPAAVLALLLFGLLAYVALSTTWRAGAELRDQPTTALLAQALFDPNAGFIFPFELASVLLLAVMIGAIALVREK